MPDYRAISSGGPRIVAWIWNPDPADVSDDPAAERKHGWRVQIQRESDGEMLRYTWVMTMEEALGQTDMFFPENPDWRRMDTGEPVNLYGQMGMAWKKEDP
jgi:hypothetical protein